MGMPCSSVKPSPARALSRPFVLVSMSMTADGKIATASRNLSRFGSRSDVLHLYALRSGVDAILCGARTVMESDASLGPGPRRFRLLRQGRGLAAHPLRIVVSGMARLSPKARIFRSGSGPVIVLTSRAASRKNRERLRRVAQDVVCFGRSRVDLRAALHWLRREHGVRRLLCEGGSELNAAVFRGGLVDELHLTIVPLLFGGAGAPTLADGPHGLPLARSLRATLRTRRVRGGEIFLVYALHRPR